MNDDLFIGAYKYATNTANFDINAGQELNLDVSLSDTIEQVKEQIESGKGICCFHASIYLSSILNALGIYSELIITPELAIIDGKARTDNRLSVLYYDECDKKYYVANPIEDIEMFSNYNMNSDERLLSYKNESGELIFNKKDFITTVVSNDASKIPADDFIQRYGSGDAWTIGSIYNNDLNNTTFNNMLSQAKYISPNNISFLDQSKRHI